jgi:stage II sporulation protein M
MAMFFFIFVNNAVKAFAVVLLGSLFGIVPVLFVAVNGILIGLMSSVIVAKHGANYLFAGTIPHGILEIPAFLIAASYGLELGRRYYRKIRYSDPFKPYLMKVMGKTLRNVFPLLAVASFIETFITMTILRSL